MASKTSLYKHHCLSIYIPPSRCLLHNPSDLPSHRKIYHTNGNFLPFPLKIRNHVDRILIDYETSFTMFIILIY